MRKPEEMGWYAELGADGEPRSVHGIKHLMPEGSVEITEAQAREISAQVRDREPKIEGSQPAAQSSAPPVDLQPVYDQLAKHAELIADHAGLHDKHVSEIQTIRDEHAEMIDDLMRRTAGAIAQITEGIGDKQG